MEPARIVQETATPKKEDLWTLPWSKGRVCGGVVKIRIVSETIVRSLLPDSNENKSGSKVRPDQICKVQNKI